MKLSSTEKLVVIIDDKEVEISPHPSSSSVSILEEFKIDQSEFRMYGNLMLSLADVFKCFNNVVSHNLVRLKVSRNDRVEIMDWTAQKAGFLCLIFRMVNSDCETFARFREYINLLTVTPSPHFFIKTNVTEIFFEKASKNEHIDLHVVKELALERNREASDILLKIVQHLQGKFRKDSILNSIVMALNIATINYEFFDEYIAELKTKYQL